MFMALNPLSHSAELQGDFLTQSGRDQFKKSSSSAAVGVVSNIIHDIVFHVIQSKTLAQGFDRTAPECITHFVRPHWPRRGIKDIQVIQQAAVLVNK
jgi:hypothetical protein